MSLTSAPSIGAIAAEQLSRYAGYRPAAPSGAPHRTGAPVLRLSKEAGTFEEEFFAVPAPGETDHLLRMVKRTCDAGRRAAARLRAGETVSKAERELKDLTLHVVRLFESICEIARLNRGRVYPSYDYLAEHTGLGRATVARGIKVLIGLGFLVRQRRFKREVDEVGERRYKQTSNAYRLAFPEALVKLLPRWMRPPPVPVDEVQRDADRQDDFAHMLSRLNCRELVHATMVDTPLSRQLARLGARIDGAGCES